MAPARKKAKRRGLGRAAVEKTDTAEDLVRLTFATLNRFEDDWHARAAARTAADAEFLTERPTRDRLLHIVRSCLAQGCGVCSAFEGEVGSGFEAD